MTRRGAPRPPRAPAGRTAARWALAGLLTFTGAGHLTWGRRGFRIVVPEWAVRVSGFEKDAIVVGSGVAELVLAAALLGPRSTRRQAGLLTAVFFASVFPGNVHQWRTRRDSPGMRSDRARLVRLALQPLLIAWALAATR